MMQSYICSHCWEEVTEAEFNKNHGQKCKRKTVPISEDELVEHMLITMIESGQFR